MLTWHLAEQLARRGQEFPARPANLGYESAVRSLALVRGGNVPLRGDGVLFTPGGPAARAGTPPFAPSLPSYLPAFLFYSI